MLAQVPGDAALVEAFEEERHVAILLERKRIPRDVAANREFRACHAGGGEIGSAHNQPAMAGVLEVGEEARLGRARRDDAGVAMRMRVSYLAASSSVSARWRRQWIPLSSWRTAAWPGRGRSRIA